MSHEQNFSLPFTSCADCPHVKTLLTQAHNMRIFRLGSHLKITCLVKPDEDIARVTGQAGAGPHGIHIGAKDVTPPSFCPQVKEQK